MDLKTKIYIKNSNLFIKNIMNVQTKYNLKLKEKFIQTKEFPLKK